VGSAARAAAGNAVAGEPCGRWQARRRPETRAGRQNPGAGAQWYHRMTFNFPIVPSDVASMKWITSPGFPSSSPSATIRATTRACHAPSAGDASRPPADGSAAPFCRSRRSCRAMRSGGKRSGAARARVRSHAAPRGERAPWGARLAAWHPRGERAHILKICEDEVGSHDPGSTEFCFSDDSCSLENQ